MYPDPQPIAKDHHLDDFSSGDSALDGWLRHFALSDAKAGGAQTFVTCDPGTRIVVGYYALAVASLEPAEATPRALRGLPQSRAVPAVLLARLAVDKRHQGGGLGAGLLRDAMLRVLNVSRDVGVRVMLVNALTQRAADWYVRYGFEVSPTDTLQLMLLMKDLVAYLTSRPSGRALR